MNHLIQGGHTSQGLVEVHCNGQWGTVCNAKFDQTEANTVCRQLGYTGAEEYVYSGLTYAYKKLCIY